MESWCRKLEQRPLSARRNACTLAALSGACAEGLAVSTDDARIKGARLAVSTDEARANRARRVLATACTLLQGDMLADDDGTM